MRSEERERKAKVGSTVSRARQKGVLHEETTGFSLTFEEGVVKLEDIVNIVTALACRRWWRETL